MRAVATFTLDSWDPEPIDDGPGAALGRVRITKTFSGEVVGTSTVEMLTAMSGVEGSAAYVAFERIFATLGYPNASFGMVQLTREQQEVVVGVEPAVFRPVPGAWGLKGATLVLLEAADEATLRGALEAAWRLKAGKRQIAVLDARRAEAASS